MLDECVCCENESEELDEYDMIIDARDVAKYSFTRTKLEQVYSKINVEYQVDYGDSDKYFKKTGWLSAKDCFGDGDLGYIDQNGDPGYRLAFFNSTEEDTTKVFKANYITDKTTANLYKEYLCLWYCNQHTIMKLDLTLKYLQLEVGDVVRFDKVIGNVRAYGEDYSIYNMRNGQIIFPHFMITSITKTTKSVKVELIQLHKLNREDEYSAAMGDVLRDGVIDVNDFNIMDDYVLNRPETLTNEQILSMDINQDGIITYADVLLFAEQLAIDLAGED